MPKLPFIKSYYIVDRGDGPPPVIHSLLVVNFLVSAPTHNPADVGERAEAIIQCLYFGADVREAIEVCSAALVKENPGLEIEGVLNALTSEYQSSQLVPRPTEGSGGGIVLPSGSRFQH